MLARTLVASLSPRGRLDIVDLGIDEERKGPRSALYFAINMALYTQGGDVYTPSQISTWLHSAGCTQISVHRLNERVGSAWRVSGNAPQQTLPSEKEA